MPNLAAGHTSGWSLLLAMLLLVTAGDTVGWAQTLRRGYVVTERPAPRTGVDVTTLLLRGGMWRRGADYVLLPEGLGELTRMTYVDGISVGAHFTLGRVLADGARLEVEPELRWATSRQTWSGGGAVRYHFPVERWAWVEAFGSRRAEDFNPEPLLRGGQAALAMGLFGWDGMKHYELIRGGARGSGPLGDAVQLTAGWQWQRRRRLANHRQGSLFGSHASANYPDNRFHPAATAATDALQQFATHECFLYEATLDVTPGAGLLVEDDMTARIVSVWPTFTLSTRLSTRPTVRLDDDNDVRYVRLEAGVAQTIIRRPYRWRYRAATGLFLHRRDVQWADFRHFPASGFAWQRTLGITRFSLLDEYELSTDDRWLEAHGELLHASWLAARLLQSASDYVQLHLLAVTHARPHAELAYGWDWASTLRLGIALGIDGTRWDGIAVQFSLGLHGEPQGY